MWVIRAGRRETKVVEWREDAGERGGRRVLGKRSVRELE
jgi:hypothetical protein